MKKKERGITLIALVVTIIVLLILAGISITMLTGQNGILDRAEDAKKETSTATAKELMYLKLIEIRQEIALSNVPIPNELQYVADILSQDDDIEYVDIVTRRQASIDNQIQVGNATKIFVKFKSYPNELEINAKLQIAAIDGERILDELPENPSTPVTPPAQQNNCTLTIAVSVNDANYETVNINSIQVPKGSEYTINGETLIVNDQTITAKLPGYGWNATFSSWDKTSGTVNEDTTITASFTKNSTKKWSRSGTGEYTTGEVVSYGDEVFYVIPNDSETSSDNVTLFAAKNITTTGTLQQSDSAPDIVFCSRSVITSEFAALENLNNRSAIKQNTGSAIYLARQYANNLTQNVENGRLLTLEEIENLGGDGNSCSLENCPEWIKSTNYWLATAKGYYNWDPPFNSVFSVWKDDIDRLNNLNPVGCSDTSEDAMWGVRPVLTISKSLIS